MIVHRMVFLCCAIFTLSLLPDRVTFGHGGVVEEGDLCVIKVNFLSAHFKVYQPQVSGHKQFCEDLPAASESVFVMEYQHDALATMPIDFRIIRDTTGKGRFARMEDVAAIDNLDAVTVFYNEAVVDRDVYTVIHDFEKEGDYIGIVSARHPETDKIYAAVFPFEVGFTGLGYWPFFVGLLLVIQLQFLIMSGRLRRWIGRGSVAAISLLVFTLVLEPAIADELVVSYEAPAGELTINRMQSIILSVATSTGEPVLGANISVVGGMPAHNHGLPTRPRVTAELGNGRYRLDGLRFHMRGTWELVVTIETAANSSDPSASKISIVKVPLEL